MARSPRYFYNIQTNLLPTRTEVAIHVRPPERWGCGTVTYKCSKGHESGDGWYRMIDCDLSSTCASMLGVSRMLAFLDKHADMNDPASICAALDAAGCVQVGHDDLTNEQRPLNDPKFPKEGDASWMDKPYCYPDCNYDQCTVHGIVKTSDSLSPRTDAEAGQRAVLAAFMSSGKTYATRMEQWIMRGKPVEMVYVQGARPLPWRDQLAALEEARAQAV